MTLSTSASCRRTRPAVAGQGRRQDGIGDHELNGYRTPRPPPRPGVFALSIDAKAADSSLPASRYECTGTPAVYVIPVIRILRVGKCSFCKFSGLVIARNSLADLSVRGAPNRVRR